MNKCIMLSIVFSLVFSALSCSNKIKETDETYGRLWEITSAGVVLRYDDTNIRPPDYLGGIDKDTKLLDENGNKIAIEAFKMGESVCVAYTDRPTRRISRVQKSHQYPIGTFLEKK